LYERMFEVGCNVLLLRHFLERIAVLLDRKHDT
jgi:hypothetical protein